ncbi:hypothetical protein [Streptomyces sp. NRRL S-1448]|uniref:hypothetical protein n=1 Tax=Streptomyces sp. NRRL S-1448 TaxID=1463883 RepID=UPI00068F2B94|nr:hypothetical protein [Streptomyces sp. NRRL S-1448]
MTTPDLVVTFYDHEQPVATAGVYTVRLEQTLVHGGSAVDASDRLPTAEQAFEIRAARFVLDPATIAFTYPAPGSTGDYTTTLAHVTLTRSVLPWERELQVRNADGRPPWLALLVFGEDELDDDPGATGDSVTRTVAELASPGGTVLGPALGDLTSEVRASSCQTLDVPAPVFTAVVPREGELRHLTHVRYVRTAPQRNRDGEKFTEGEYAIVAANRFPRADGSYVAHLVSLEGFAGHLDELDARYTHVRLCSLHRWSFTTSTKDAFDAGALLTALAAPGRDDGEKLALRLPPAKAGSSNPSDAEKSARRRLELGYVPVRYRLPSGETSFAWYRGPCTPVKAPVVPVVGGDEPHTTADHALIYEAAHGVFDVSYAAAWTLGRTLALRDPEYTEEISRARRELGNLAVRMMAMAEDPSLAAHEPSGRYAIQELAAAGFGESLAAALAHPDGPAEPSADAPASPAQGEPAPLTHAQRIDTLATPRAAAILAQAATDRAGSMPQWLDQLALLREIPYNYLVPHPDMLPPETLRMFRIDPAWIAALVAGASDVAVSTTVDAATADALHAATTGTGKDPVAGVLIRSQLVPAWPEFDLVGYLNGRQVEELRRDRPAPDTLLVLFDAVPDELLIREPGQGIHFGLDSDATRNDLISLRHLDGANVGAPKHKLFPDTGGLFSTYLRPTHDVLDLTKLLPDLAAELDKPHLQPAQFALQLLNAPVQQTFTEGTA